MKQGNKIEYNLKLGQRVKYQPYIFTFVGDRTFFVDYSKQQNVT